MLAEADSEAEESRPRRRKSAAGAPGELPVRHKRLMPVDALQIRGLHNATNAMAALALCRPSACRSMPCCTGCECQGEPHRVEHMMTLDEVEYFDDRAGGRWGGTSAWC